MAIHEPGSRLRESLEGDALFRALAEIALREPHLALWRSDGRVGVPLSRIAERWLMYYWPIFASPTFIPQSQAEGAGEKNPVAFRAPLHRLMERFAGQGEHCGLTAWYLGWTSGRLDAETQDLARTALRSIANTVRAGPVAYSGGSLDGGRIFHYEARHVLMSIFLDSKLDRCVWSDRRLDAGFAVDHVIPFALWGSNGLWNLVPADARANNQKSDKLPTSELLRQRQAALIHVWQASRDSEPQIFDREATHLLGHKPGGPLQWEHDLFASLREAVEVTALQRGVPRWAPGD